MSHRTDVSVHLSHLAARISKLLFEGHGSILIFKGDNYPDGVIGILFRLVHCDSHGDKPVDDGIEYLGLWKTPLKRSHSSETTSHDNVEIIAARCK